MSMFKFTWLALLALLVASAGIFVYSRFAMAQMPAPAGINASISQMAQTTSVGDPYPLNTCPVTGEELGGMGDPIIYEYNGREIRFCCKGCIAKFEANPDKYIKEIDAQIIEQQKGSYPMDTCPVTGEELGGMGETVNFVYNNRLFELCCGGCVNKIKADPAKYMSLLDDAVIKAQIEDYPLDTCVVTGEKLGEMGDPIDYVFGNRLVRFCCKGCIAKFEADPLKYMAKLN